VRSKGARPVAVAVAVAVSLSLSKSQDEELKSERVARPCSGLLYCNKKKLFCCSTFEILSSHRQAR
jgi:hypothetical protein